MTTTRQDQRPGSPARDRPRGLVGARLGRRRGAVRGVPGGAGRGTLVGSALGVVLTLALLTGCEVRLESPAPPELVPDATEVARQGAAEDAAALSALARVVAAADTALAGPLEAVAAASDEHLVELGGPYVAHPEATPDVGEAAADTMVDGTGTGTGAGSESAPDPDPGTAAPSSAGSAADATATASPTPPPIPVAADVLALLQTTAASARADADALADAPLARLLAGIAVGRTLHAQVLAAATGQPVPTTSFTVPASVPAGLGAAEVTALVQAEDALGLAWEVVAARSDDEARAAAATRAAQHRDRAEAWAVAGALAGTGLDPRRAAYALPAELLDPATDPSRVTAVLGALETGIAQDYATLVASADPGARGPLLDGLADAAAAALGQTGVVPTFPGLPEQTTG